MRRRFFAFVVRTLEKKDFRVFLIFLVFSAVIWHIEKLRQDYTITSSLALDFVNVPSGYMTPHDSTLRLDVRISGNGFSLMRSQMSEQHATVSLSGMRRLSSGGKTWVVFSPKERILSETTLPEHLSISEVLTDTVMVPLLTMHKKHLPVVVRDNVSIAPQHMMSRPLSYDPDSIWVAGTSDLIDTMRAVYTVPLPPVELRAPQTVTMQFDLSDDLIANEQDVLVSYFVEPFTEKQLSVPIIGLGVPDGYSAKFYPPSARLTFSVGLSQFEAVAASDFDVVVNMEGVMPGDGTSRLRLDIVDAPSFVKNINMTPKFVEFLLEKERKDMK